MLTEDDKNSIVKNIIKKEFNNDNFLKFFGFKKEELTADKIDLEMLIKLSNFFGCTPQYLIDDDIFYERIRHLRDDRYITSNSYHEGLVCFLDIVGFSTFVKNENNFAILKDVFDEILRESIEEAVHKDIFLDALNVSIFSDSVLISSQNNEYSLKLMIQLVLRIRDNVIKKIGTDIRACITFGKYIHEGFNNQVYFGPAIVEAYKMAETKIDEDKESPLYYKNMKFIDKPIMISISKKIVDQVWNPVPDFLEVLNDDFYILNPFLFNYRRNKIYYFSKTVSERRKYFDEKIDIEKAHLEKTELLDMAKKNKYKIYKLMLEKFIEFYQTDISYRRLTYDDGQV